MTRFDKITIENYRTIEHAEFEYKPGLYRVVGLNHDDAGANDNGSGKSAFLEAFYWAQTGEVLREDKYSEDVVRKFGGAGCRVRLAGTDAAGRPILIDRQRNGAKAGLVISINGKPADKLNQQQKRDTQAVLYDILGTDAEILRTVDVLTNAKEFLGASESKRKELLEKLLRMVVMAEARERAKAERDVINKRITELDKAARVLDVTVTGARSRLAEFETQLAGFEVDRARRLAAVDEKIAPLDVQLTTKRGDVTTKQGEIANLEDRLRELAATVTDPSALTEAAATISDCDAVIINASSQVRTLDRDIAQLDSKLAHLQKGHLAGSDCNECGKPVTKDDLARYIAAIQNDRRLKAVAADPWRQQLKDAQEVRIYAVSQKTEIEKRAKSLEEQVNAARNGITTRQHEIRTLTEGVSGLERQRALLASQADTIRAETPSLAPAIEKERETIAAKEPELTALNATLTKDREELRYLEWWEDGFGPAGLRSFALDAVMPLLNETMQKYMNDFSSSFTVSYSPQSNTKKGEAREKLSLNVKSRSGVDALGSGSGGEQRRIALADFFARRRLRAMRLPEPNVLIVDEALDQVDAVGAESLAKVLVNEAKTKCVLMVAHNEHLAAYPQKIIRVERRNNVSTVEVV